MLVGLDEQLLRSTPRAEVLVKRGQSVRRLSSTGGVLTVDLPGDPIVLSNDPDSTDSATYGDFDR